jgi:hypothetical protein
MDRDDGVGMEQRGLRHGAPPRSTIPRVDLHTYSEAMKMDLIADGHCDVGWNLGSAVIVSWVGQSRQACAEQQSHRTGAGFVGGKSRQYIQSEPAKSWRFIYRFRVVSFFDHNRFHCFVVSAPQTGPKS